jgi:hypothetical protein
MELVRERHRLGGGIPYAVTLGTREVESRYGGGEGHKHDKRKTDSQNIVKGRTFHRPRLFETMINPTNGRELPQGWSGSEREARRICNENKSKGDQEPLSEYLPPNGRPSRITSSAWGN